MTASPSFLGFPDRLADGRMPRAVIFGAGHGSTYPGEDSIGHDLAADAIRAASQVDAALVEHWDFDLGGPLFDGQPVGCIDAGDIATTMHDNAGNRARIEAKTREILVLPAVPILLGGDDSVPIPFFAGFADHGPVWILQIDAHIDWRDELHGERYGYSNPMRRASEMPHVAGIVQVGIRGVGSARLTEIEAARHYGSRIVTAREFHAQGVEAALRQLFSFGAEPKAMAHGRNKYQSRENRARVREILLRDWDPVGVYGIPEATDEYDAYANKAYVMLMDEGAPPRVISQTICSLWSLSGWA